jgi:putative tricarboxylic transport membrane protein
MTDIVDAFGLFDAETAALLLAAIVIGFVTGALPGFSSSNAVALLLPVSIGMETHHALIFMAGIYCGAQYGGAPPAILLNAPGEPGGAATALDGYPMTKRGEGLRALGIARAASGLSGVIAALVVIAAFAPLTDLLLDFGAPELFAIAVLGLAVVSAVGGSNVFKGLLIGALGVLVSLISADPVYGTPRMTFGILDLYDEVPFVPALIGLFALSELATIAQRGQVVVDVDDARRLHKLGWRGELGQLAAGFGDVLSRPLHIIRGSLIGTAVGIIPGAGSSISNFLSYGLARRLSRKPETYGTGNPEGIIASEAADNGVTAGAMVPTFGFGIPGGGTTAVMLAALVLHGIQPGPGVLRDQAPLVYGVMLAILFASILTIPLGTALGALLVRVVLLPARFLVPGVVVLAFIGTYSFRNSSFDLLLLPLFGIFGYVLRKHDYPLVPFVLGLILGPLAEGNFNRSLLISQGDWSIFVRGSIAPVVWALVLLVVVVLPLLEWRRRRASRPG